jgi:hypothetical protein
MTKGENDSFIDPTLLSSSEPVLKPCPLCGAVMEVRYEKPCAYWIHPGRQVPKRTDCSLREVVIIDEPEDVDAWNERDRELG